MKRKKFKRSPDVNSLNRQQYKEGKKRKKKEVAQESKKKCEVDDSNVGVTCDLYPQATSASRRTLSTAALELVWFYFHVRKTKRVDDIPKKADTKSKQKR